MYIVTYKPDYARVAAHGNARIGGRWAPECEAGAGEWPWSKGGDGRRCMSFLVHDLLGPFGHERRTWKTCKDTKNHPATSKHVHW